MECASAQLAWLALLHKQFETAPKAVMREASQP